MSGNVVRRLSLLCFAVVVIAVGTRAEQTPEQIERQGPQDPAELETYLEGLIPSLMETHHIPGAVMIVVKDGEIFLAKGYGFADLESRRPVDPATTLFRVASVSKLFTATAAMQLVEQNKLDLQADVNATLLDFKIEERFGKPVTLANLLTHTPGFDDEFLRTSQPLDEVLVPLGRFLAEEMPKRVLPPGDMISYSNQGLALAGYLVEQVSSLPFEEYVHRNVLAPLGMNRTRFGIPTPVPQELATPYEYKGGKHRRRRYDRLIDFPAGDLITTGTDIARFMIAHLRLGKYKDARILEEGTARMMQSRQFVHHPRLTGWCYGFVEGRANGLRTIGHGGSWRGFGTQLLLIPEHDFGLFLSTNLDYSPGFFRTAQRQFFHRYFAGGSEPAPTPSEDFVNRAKGYAGSYLSIRRIRNSILKLRAFRSVARLSSSDEGTLVFRHPNDFLPPMKLVEVEPGLLREIDGDAMVSFRTDENGQVSHMFIDGFSLEKLRWYENPNVHSMAWQGAAGLFALTALG